MGRNIYYVTLMSLQEVSARIRVGEEIHQSKGLSDMVQRALKAGRDEEIADYLRTVEERFFNAMVVGVYGGQPDWKPFVRDHNSVDVSSLPLDTVNAFGFLELRGDEKLFPLDGQHRLVGVQRALKDSPPANLGAEEMTVIFLAHDKDTKTGRERSRRLFTVLNKRAKPVNKNEIIALDEDDAMAIVTRMLVEGYGPLTRDRVFYSASSTMPTGQSAFTTIGALYDSMGLLFPRLTSERRKALEDVRPSVGGIDYLSHCACAFFDALAVNVPEFTKYIAATDAKAAAFASRNPSGGNILFRPIGLKIYADIVAHLLADWTIEDFKTLKGRQLTSAKADASKAIGDAVRTATSLPLSLSQAPYKDVLWDTATHKIQAGRAALTRDLLLNWLGLIPDRKLPRLRERYALATGKDPTSARLPKQPGSMA